MKEKGPKKPLGAPVGGLLATGAPRSAKQQAATLGRLGCTACPLNAAPITTPKMQPTIVPGAAVYFLAEAPGRDEDENTGRPLTGPSGRLLRECLEGEQQASFDNVVNCRPDGNRTPTWQEAECCRPRRVKWIEEAKPKLIVGLGAVPLHFMLNSKDIAGMRGRCFAVKVGSHSCWFLPTYHPSFILRTAYDKKKPLQSRLGHCFRMDIKKAFELAEELEAPTIEGEADVRRSIQSFDGGSPGNFDSCLDLLRLASSAPVKAIDIETKGLRPYSEGAAIMSVAISFDGPIAQRLEQVAYNRQVGGSNPSGTTNFSFAWDHPKAKWTDKQKLKIGVALQRLLKDNTIKIAHNAPFECEWFIWLFGKDVINHAAWECTQMQAHFLDERRGRQATGSDAENRRAVYQSLDFLIKMYFGIAFKGLFKVNKKDMSQSDLNETLIYNAVDTKFTLRLWHAQRRLLQARGLHDAYLEALPRQPTVALMQSLGVAVDQVEVKRIQGELETEIKDIVGQINDLKVVQAYIAQKGEFNPQSGNDVVAIFRDFLKRPEVFVDDRISVDKGVLDQIDHPLSLLIIQLRNKSKLKSTYVDGLELGKGQFVYPDGSIHCNFNTTFAETGRTSSDDCNMQNFPQRKDAWVRKQIVPQKGHVLLAFDYGQLEGCTGAMCSKDKVLVKALWEDYDIHQEWAQKVAVRCPEIVGGEMSDPKVAKSLRSRIKNKFVFPSFFGAQAKSIAGYLGIDEAAADDLVNEFWATFSGYKRWQDTLMKGYYENGYVESPTGRRHHYPLTRNQAINHPVQSLACDIVCDAMNRLSFEAASTGKWYLHPIMNIHDDLTASVPDDDRIIEEAIETYYKTMLTPPYPCVNVPLSVKASIGYNWFEMQEVGQFWSNKDV